MATPLPRSHAGCYFIVADDGDMFLVVGVLVAGHAWVAGRWTTREAAEADAARWTALELEATAA